MVRLLLQFRPLGFDPSGCSLWRFLLVALSCHGVRLSRDGSPFVACSINRHSPWGSLRDKAFPSWFAFCCSVVLLVSIFLVARCGASLWLPCHVMSLKTIFSIFMLSTLFVVLLCCFILVTLSCRVFQNDLFKRSMLVLLAGASCWKLHLFRVLHEGTLV